MAALYSDLAEHTGTLVAIIALALTTIGGLLFIIGRLFWRLISETKDESKRVGEKIDHWFEVHTGCREKQEQERKEMIEKFEFGLKEIREVRREDWQRFFWTHTHGDHKEEVRVPRILPLK